MKDHNRRFPQFKSRSSPDTPAKMENQSWFLRAFTDTILDAGAIKLSDRARFVLMVLDARAATDAFCFPGNKWLRDKTGKSDSTLAEIFLELEGQGWIRRVFTEAQKRERIGFIFLRRIDPETSPSVEDSPGAIERATSAMISKIISLASGNPESTADVSPEIRSQRLRKSGVNVSENPESTSPRIRRHVSPEIRHRIKSQSSSSEAMKNTQGLRRPRGPIRLRLPTTTTGAGNCGRARPGQSRTTGPLRSRRTSAR